MSIDSYVEATTPTLAECEAVIERGMQSFLDVGNALIAIKINSLYEQEGYSRFEDYCRSRWNISRGRGYQLMTSAAVYERLAESMSTNVDTAVLPSNEAQTRPLAPLPADQQAEVWQAAVESADGAQPTAAQVQSAVAHITQTTRTTESTKVERDVDLESGEIVNFPTPPINDDPEVLALITEHPEVLDMNRDEIGAIAAAIEEFPFLDDYPYEQIVSTADALRAVPEGPERDKRIEAAKTWPAAVAARDTTPKTLTSTDRTRMAIAEVLNITEAIQKSAVIGHAEQAAREIDADERDEWREVVELALSTCRALLEAITTPTTLRRVK